MFSWLLLLAAQTLDMTAEDQQNTGLSKLTEEEKGALEAWIDLRYVRHGEPMAQVAIAQTKVKQKNPILQDVLNNGRYIRLSDHSTWEIDPQDTPISQGWITPVEIIVAAASDRSTYPYTLTNSLTGSSIHARKASSVPDTSQTPTPPAATGPTGMPAPKKSK
jgi:hypothetical protein